MANLVSRAYFVKNWFDFIKSKLQQDIVLSSFLMTIATTAAKLVAAVKEITVAHHFGIGDDLDAYLIAYLFSTFFIIILSVSFAPAIIPTYIKVKNKAGKHESRELLRSITTWSLLFMTVVFLLLLTLRSTIIPVLGSGFDSSKMEKTMSMATMLLPILIIWGMSAVWGAVLNAHKKFVVVALSPAIISISLIISLVLGAKDLGIFALVLGTLIGHLIELSVIGYYIRKEGLPLGLKLGALSGPLKRIIYQFRLLSIAALMSTGMTIVDQAMAGMLESGSISALNYGYRLVGILISLSSSIWIVALPHFSIMVNERNFINLKALFFRYCKFALTISIPLVTLLIIASTLIVKLLFERGAFLPEDSIIVAQIQRLYLLQLPFCISAALIMRLFSALSMNTILMWGGVLSFILNILFNFLFIKIMGVEGIALSTAVVSIVSPYLCYSAIRACRKLAFRYSDYADTS